MNVLNVKLSYDSENNNYNKGWFTVTLFEIRLVTIWNVDVATTC